MNRWSRPAIQYAWLIASLTLVTCPLAAQSDETENTEAQNVAATAGQADARSPAMPTPLILTVTEVTLDLIDDEVSQRLRATDDLDKVIDAMAAEGQVKNYNQLRLTILANGSKVMAQYGQRVPTLSNTQLTSRGRINAISMTNIGRMLEAAASQTGDQIDLELTFEASDLEQSAESTDSPAIVNTRTFRSVMKLNLGQTTLASVHQSADTTLLLVAVESPGPLRLRPVEVQPIRVPAVVEPPNTSAPRRATTTNRTSTFNAFAERLFSRFDADKDGGFDGEEYAQIRGSTRTLPEQWSAADTNGDGKLQLDEFTSLLRESRGSSFRRAPTGSR